MGEKVFEDELLNINGSHQLDIHLNAPPGMYFVRLSTDACIKNAIAVVL